MSIDNFIRKEHQLKHINCEILLNLRDRNRQLLEASTLDSCFFFSCTIAQPTQFFIAFVRWFNCCSISTISIDALNSMGAPRIKILLDFNRISSFVSYTIFCIALSLVVVIKFQCTCWSNHFNLRKIIAPSITVHWIDRKAAAESSVAFVHSFFFFTISFAWR